MSSEGNSDGFLQLRPVTVRKRLKTFLINSITLPGKHSVTFFWGNCGCFVKLMEINSNLFSGYINVYVFQSCPLEEKNIKPTFPSGLNYPLCVGSLGDAHGLPYIYISTNIYVLLKETPLSKKLENKNNRNKFEHFCKTT